MKQIDSVFRFPRICRQKPARACNALICGGLWVLLCVSFVLNLILLSFHNPIRYYVSNVLTYPFSADAHVSLAQQYRVYRDPTRTKNELDVASWLMNTFKNSKENSNVLGVANIAQNLQMEWEKEDMVLQSAYSYWHTVANQRPDYRDAYVMVAVTASQLGNCTQASSALAQARKLSAHLQQADAIFAEYCKGLR